MHIGALTLDLNPITIPILIILVLGLIEVIRTWGVTTRPLAFAIFVLVVIQVLWLLGFIGVPGTGDFQKVDVWLAIVDALVIPLSVALAYMAAGRRTVPIASMIGILAFVHLLIVTGIVNIRGII